MVIINIWCVLFVTLQLTSQSCFQTNVLAKFVDIISEVKVSRNCPERRSGKRIIAGTAFRLEFLVGWYYDADATMAVPELY